MPAERVTSRSPWHVAFIIDDSASMDTNDGAKSVNDAMDMMIEEMRSFSQGLKPYFKISIISFGSDAHDICVVENEMKVDKSRITQFRANSGSTNAAAALDRGHDILRANPGEATDFEPFVFFLSDGAPDDPGKALAAGSRIKELFLASGKPRLVTIGFGDANDSFMRQLASNAELYLRISSPDQIKDFLKLLPPVGTRTGAGGAEGVEDAIKGVAQDVAQGGVMQL